jgi:TolA-binding protein
MKKQFIASALMLSFAASLSSTETEKPNPNKMITSSETKEKDQNVSKQEEKQPSLQALLKAQRETNALLGKIVKNQERQARFRKEQREFNKQQEMMIHYLFSKAQHHSLPLYLEKKCAAIIKRKKYPGLVHWY